MSHGINWVRQYKGGGTRLGLDSQSTWIRRDSLHWRFLVSTVENVKVHFVDLDASGSYRAAQYAVTFPRHVGRFVLDAVAAHGRVSPILLVMIRSFSDKSCRAFSIKPRTRLRQPLVHYSVQMLIARTMPAVRSTPRKEAAFPRLVGIRTEDQELTWSRLEGIPTDPCCS